VAMLAINSPKLAEQLAQFRAQERDKVEKINLRELPSPS